MKILGIDPGMAILGWSVLDSAPGALRCLDFGCLRTSPAQTLSERLAQIYDQLILLLQKHTPHVMAVETLYFVKNAKTLAQVGHTRGVILLAAGQNNVDIHEYAPRQIKMALTGFGGADKRQMQMMVQRILRLKEIPQPDDAADAVAVALCHAQYAHALGKSAVTV